MKSKIIIFIILVFIMALNTLAAQSVKTRGRFTNSIYTFENKYRSNTDTSHVLLYQFLRFSIGAKELNNLKFNFSGRALTDLVEDLPDEQRFRAYRLSISVENLFNNLLDLEIGRQFLHPGITFGSLDGVNLNFKFTRRFSWQIFGGLESHLFRSFKMINSDKPAVYGTSLKFHNLSSTDLQLAYFQKRRSGKDQWQIAGLNFSNYSVKMIRLMGQLHYDFVNSRVHRLYLALRYLPSHKWNLVLNVKQQYPQIYGDSFFKIFKVYQYRQIGLSSGYNFNETYSLGGRYHYIKLEEGGGHRFILTLNDRNGSLGFVYETGDLGNQVGIMFDYGYEIFTNFIASLSIDYSRYRLEEIYDYENQLANAVRATYKFSCHWRIDLEYQWLNNRFKNSDHRFLNHIHYIW